MTKNKNNDALIEDDASETLAAQSETPPSQKSRKVTLFIALLALILIFVVIGLGAYFYKENKLLTNQQQAEIIQVNKKITQQKEFLTQSAQKSLALQANLQAQVEQVNSQLIKVNNANKLYQTDMKALQRAFAEAQVRHPNDWILAEVEYLVKLAGRKIWLEKDLVSAAELLLAADQRIAELNDPSLSKLRSALLEDINTLEAIPKHDPDGVVLALSALERRIDKLAIIGLTQPQSVAKSATKLSEDVNDWQANLAKSWSSFIDSFIVINKRDIKLQALLSPEQRWYLQENLRHDLAKAEFAVYREQQEIYDLALHSAANLLKSYYDLNDTATKHFYKSLQNLSQSSISIDYPDQLKSAPLLEQIIEQRVKKSLTSARVEQE